MNLVVTHMSEFSWDWRLGESNVSAHVRQCARGGERIERKNGKISPSCALLQDYGCGLGPTHPNLSKEFRNQTFQPLSGSWRSTERRGL